MVTALVRAGIAWVTLGVGFAMLGALFAVAVRSLLARRTFWADLFAEQPGQEHHPARYALLLVTVGLAVHFLQAVLSASGPEHIRNAVTVSSWLDVDGAGGMAAVVYLLSKGSGGNVLRLLGRR